MHGLGDKVGINDKVYFDNKIVNLQKEKIYILLNKPTGYVTTLDLIPLQERIVPVGRLDMYTSRSNYSYQ